MTNDTTAGLVISSSRMIHVEGCQYVAGYIDGKRVRVWVDGERPLLDATYPDENTEVLHFGPTVEVEHRREVDMRLSPSDLTHAYRRCRKCAPNVPEWAAPPGTRRRQLRTLTHRDIGRKTTEGELIAVAHTADRVRLQVGDRLVEGGPDETVDFYVAQPGGGDR